MFKPAFPKRRVVFLCLCQRYRLLYGGKTGFGFVPIEPFGDIIQIEKHLVAYPYHRHVVIFCPKLNGANVQTHIVKQRCSIL
jgi:hypothetical protein